MIVENLAIASIFVSAFMFEVLRRKHVIFDMMSAFILFFLVFYLLPLALVHNNVASVKSYYPSLVPISDRSLEVTVSLLISYSLVLFGYTLSSYIRIPVLTPNHSTKNNRRYIALSFIFALVFFGGASLAFYVFQNGGLINTLATSFLIRTGVVDAVAKYGFVLRFVPLLEVAAYLTLSYMLFFRCFDMRYKCFYVLLLLVVFLWLLIKGGRGQIIWFVLTNFGIIIMHSGRFRVLSSKLIFSFIFVVLVIAYGKDFFSLLQTIGDPSLDAGRVWDERQAVKESGSSPFHDFVHAYVHNTKHLLTSIAISIDTVEAFDAFTYFSHCFSGLTAIIPTGVFGVPRVTTISDINTFYHIGEFESIIPPGFIAFSLYSLGWIGLAISSLIFGLVGGGLNTFSKNLAGRIFCGNFLLVILALVWTGFYTSGDPFIFYRSRFILMLVLMVLVFVICRVRFEFKVKTLSALPLKTDN